MKKHYYLFWGIGSWAIATLSLSLPIQAQIIPDATLPVNSIVTPDGNTYLIEGGTSSGGNLFHSFEAFSLPTNSTAFFNNAIAIQNIFSRITGESISNIDGLIQANDNANLYLLNPNGIIFGPNAKLNLGGSFFASTANQIDFSDRSFYSATQPQTQPILTNSVPIGLGFGSNPGQIVNQSVASNSSGEIIGLSVLPGQTLAFIGGDIALNRGHLSAPNGQIQLISVATGEWRFNRDRGEIPNFNYKDIQLTQQAAVNTSGMGGGEIQIQGRTVSVRDGSQIVGITRSTQPGGNLTVNATEKIEVIGNSPDGLIPSRISSQTEGAGNAGNLTLQTGQLIIDNGIVSAATLGSGNGGNLTVRATDSIELSAGLVDGLPRGLINAALGSADAGDLTVETRRLTVRNGAAIASGTRSTGNGGNLTIRATESVELIGTSPDGLISSTLQSGATDGPEPIRMRFGPSLVTGDAANLSIETGTLIVREGALVSTGTDGTGKGGNLNIRASSVEVSGTSADGQFPSRLLSDTTNTGVGGDLTINTGQFLLTDGGLISARTFGTGTGGNLTLNASDSVEIVGAGFENFQQTFIAGALSGRINLSQLRNGLFTGTAGAGASGDITIETGKLLLREGAAISTTTFSEGLGGNLTVRASEKVEAIASGLFSATLADAAAAGDITINTPELIIRDGANVSTVTLGSGAGGNVNVQGADIVEIRSTPALALVATGIFTNTIGGTGQAGDITIDTGTLILRDGGQALTNSGASTRDGVIPLGGLGGNLTINASESVELSSVAADGRVASALGASTFSASAAGSLSITSDRLIIRDGAGAFGSTEGTGRGATLTVRASSVELSGTSSQNRFRRSGLFATSGSDLFPIEAAGMGGDLRIVSDRLQVRDGAEVSVNSVESGDAGTLLVQAESIELDNEGAINASTVSGLGGNITLQARQIELRRGSQIATNAGNTDGGNITIDSDTLVALENSDITANALQGRGGRVSIDASGIFGTEFRTEETSQSDITASSQLGAQFSGTVEIATPEVDLQNAFAELSAEFVSSDQVVATSCLARRNNSQTGTSAPPSFTVTGTGGLPATPYDALSDRYDMTGVRGLSEGMGTETDSEMETFPDAEQGEIRKPGDIHQSWKLGDRIQEAQGIIVTANGRTLLGTLPQLAAIVGPDDLVCD